MARVNKCYIALLCVGLLVLLVGILMVTVIFPTVVEKKVISNVVLEENTLQWYRFEKIPFDFNFNVHLFTIENEAKVLAGEEVPKVKEVGPFVYKEKHAKIITKVEGDQIEYSDQLSYIFNETESGDNTEDMDVTVLNSPLMAILQSLEILPFSLGVNIEDIVSNIFDNTNIFMNVKVKDLTFGGIKMCHHENTGMSKLVCLVIMLMNQKLLEYNKDLSMSFSLFKYKTKIDGPFTLNAGTADIEKLGLISSYKGQEYTEFWKGEQNQCDHVNGFYTTFPPFMEKGSSYSVYSTDICKTIQIKQTSLSTYESIPGYKFQTFEQSFATDDEDCVCIDKTKGLNGTNRCYRKGSLDMNTCMGVPVLLSFPHLMWADADLKESVTGLNPSVNDHNTMITFEPNLGYPVSGNIRLQFNMILRPTTFGGSQVELTKNLKPAVMPMLWLDNNFAFPDVLVEEVNSKLLDMLTLAEAVQWTAIGVGCAVIILGIFLLWCCRK